VPPSVKLDYDTTEINTTLNGIASGVLANDTDEDDILPVTQFSVNLDLLL
jgi:hypothetical protein